MADVALTNISGGGSGFQTGGKVLELVASGSSGDLLALPTVLGKVYRITHLASAGAGAESGVSLAVNGTTIESGKSLAREGVLSATLSSVFAVSQYASSSDTSSGRRIYNMIECSSFTVSKDSGSTSYDMAIAYEIGEYK